MVVLGIVFVAVRLFVLVYSIALHIKDVCLGQTRTACALRSRWPFVLRPIKLEEQVKVDRFYSLFDQPTPAAALQMYPHFQYVLKLF